MKKISLFGRELGAKAIAALAVISVVAMALATQYVEGTATGTVKQAILINGCDSGGVGTCTVADDEKSFSWSMGNEVYQGSTYTATVTLKNLGNNEITVKPQVVNVTATGGNNNFEGSVSVSPDTVTVPAATNEGPGTANFTVTVNIHPAEEPGEQYTINITVVPVSQG